MKTDIVIGEELYKGSCSRTDINANGTNDLLNYSVTSFNYDYFVSCFMFFITNFKYKWLKEMLLVSITYIN